MKKHERSLTLTRIFDAPRERVFAAWTKAEHLAHWWGPQGFTVPNCEVDARPGGALRLCMRSPDGKDYWMRGTYREVAAPERLVITCTADDEKGITRLECVINVTFAEQGGKTKLTLHTTASGAGAEAAAMLEGMEEGWKGSLDRLTDQVATKGNAMQVQPYLFFDGRADEALEFYRKALGAKVEMLMRHKESPEPPPPGMLPPGCENKVMHACFRIGETAVMASDGKCAGKPSFQGFSLSLTVPNEAEAERLFASLADGGQVHMALGKTFFSPRFGMVADRFGVSWMVYVAP